MRTPGIVASPATASGSGDWIDLHAPVVQFRGGDIAELLLAAALVTTWRRSTAYQTAATPHTGLK